MEDADGATVMVLGGSIARADIPVLCERVRALLERGGGGPVVCDVAAVVGPDAVTVDALARLQLTARRFGRRVRLRHACDELRSLLALMALDEVLPCAEWSGFQPRGQSEEGEQARRVQEEADPGDPTA